MKIFAWITLGAVLFVIAALLYYLVVGAILFHIVFSKRNISDKILRKDFSKKIEKYKVDLCWWEKVKFAKISVKSFDQLNLSGNYYDAKSNKTAIVVHGFGGSYREMQQYCKLFFEKGFNVLAIDNRTHGDSEGKGIGFGWLDRKDILTWIDFLNEKKPENKILLFGLSMGGTAVCCTAGEKLPPNVCAIVSDCAFDNANKQINYTMKKYRVVLRLIKKHVYSYSKRIHGFDVLEANAIKQVKKTTIPILFIHGQDDNFVTIENMNNLYNSTPTNLRDRFVVEGAGHAMSYPIAGIDYEKKISDFLRSRTSL